MKKVAVVLSGCGHRDGAEITEAVSTLIALGQCGASYQIFAPDMNFPVTNHLSGQPVNQTRNAREEAARIGRGQVKDLKELNARDFDALAFPGGFGAAVNLCTWGKKGAQCDVLPEVSRVIHEFYKGEKPIAAICIAPALIARVLGADGVTVTIGSDPETVAEITKTGAHHETCPVEDFVTDRDHRIVTTPAYMYPQAKPSEVFTGIQKAIQELVEMA